MEYPTPTPWTVSGPAEPGWQEDPDFDFYEVHGSDGDLVALAAGEGNARLIVAQSDLLAALERAIDGEECKRDGVRGDEPQARDCPDDDDEGAGPSFWCWVCSARAAISKAKEI